MMLDALSACLLGWQCYLIAACCQLLCATDRLFSALLQLLPVVAVAVCRGGSSGQQATKVRRRKPSLLSLMPPRHTSKYSFSRNLFHRQIM